MTRLLFAFVLCAGPALWAQDAAQNVEEARACLKRKEFKEAEIATRAALLVDPGHMEAHLLLHGALSGLGEAEGAALAALDAFNAPRRGAKDAAAMARNARKLAADASKTLGEFLDLRAKCAAELIRVRATAVRMKRTADVEWLEIQTFKLAPVEELVLKESRGRSEKYWRQRGAGGLKPLLEHGFRSLLDYQKDWKTFDPGANTVAGPEELILTRNGQGHSSHIFLPRDDARTGAGFTLRFEFKWTPWAERPPTATQHLYVEFLPEKKTSPGDQILTIAPNEPTASVGHFYAQADGFLHPQAEDKIDMEMVSAGKWFNVEVRWSERTNKIRLLIDQKVVLTASTEKRSLKNNYFGFAVRRCEKLQVRNPRVQVHRE